MRILYCGDQDRAPLYIEGALTQLGHHVMHIDNTAAYPTTEHFDALFLSDYPAARILAADSDAITAQVAAGSRFIMVGGWESFNAFGSNYFNHPLSRLVIPVTMRPDDDRMNAHQGLILEPLSKGNAKTQPLWQAPPVIVGYNDARAKEDTETLVGMRQIHSNGKDVILGERLPLVIKGHYQAGTTIACLTDLAPHWCGGLIDWGESTISFENGIDVGDSYPKFLQFLLEA